MSTTIAIGDAKANLSAVIKRVGSLGEAYTVTVRGVPTARIVPISKPAPRELKAMGILAGRRPPATREEEKAAYADALEAKYVDPA